MDNINFIRKIAWSFQKTTNLDFDDLFQEAAIAYLKAKQTHNPKKGKITTYAFWCISSHLKNYIKKEKEQNSLSFEDEFISDTPITSVINDLTIDAKELINLILENPCKYSLMKPKEVKKEIGYKLIKKGWSWCKLWSVMKELKLAYT